MPEHLVIQSDNTVSQTKNTYVHIALAYLAAIKQFKRVSVNYLMVGHTHSNSGQEHGVEWNSAFYSTETWACRESWA